MGLIYLDTCLVIYLAERDPRWSRRVERAMKRAGDCRFAVSPLVKMGCLVGPIKRGDLLVQTTYEQWFATFVSLSMPELVYRQAAQLRALSGLRTPDALHVACAQHHRCEALWTNDSRLSRTARGLARAIPR